MSCEYAENSGQYITSPEEYLYAAENDYTDLTHLRAHHIKVLLESIGSYTMTQKRYLALPHYNPEEWGVSEKRVFMEASSMWLAGWANCYLSKIKYDEYPPEPIAQGYMITRNYSLDLLGDEGMCIDSWFEDNLKIISSVINTNGDSIIKLTKTPDEICFACKSTPSGQPGIHCLKPRSDNLPKDIDHMDTLEFIMTSQKIEVPHITNHIELLKDGTIVVLPMKVLRSEEFLRIFASCHNHLSKNGRRINIDWAYSDIYFGKD
jgi:hypothetical protein